MARLEWQKIKTPASVVIHRGLRWVAERGIRRQVKDALPGEIRRKGKPPIPGKVINYDGTPALLTGNRIIFPNNRQARGPIYNETPDGKFRKVGTRGFPNPGDKIVLDQS